MSSLFRNYSLLCPFLYFRMSIVVSSSTSSNPSPSNWVLLKHWMTNRRFTVNPTKILESIPLWCYPSVEGPSVFDVSSRLCVGVGEFTSSLLIDIGVSFRLTGFPWFQWSTVGYFPMVHESRVFRPVYP